MRESATAGQVTVGVPDCHTEHNMICDPLLCVTQEPVVSRTSILKLVITTTFELNEEIIPLVAHIFVMKGTCKSTCLFLRCQKKI